MGPRSQMEIRKRKRKSMKRKISPHVARVVVFAFLVFCMPISAFAGSAANNDQVSADDSAQTPVAVSNSYDWFKAASSEQTITGGSKPGKAQKMRNRRTLGWALLGVGLGALAFGGVSYALAADEHGKFEDALTTNDADKYRDKGKNYELLGQVLFGVGAVGTGAGIYFVVTSPKIAPTLSERTIFAGFTSTGDAHAAALGMNF